MKLSKISLIAAMALSGLLATSTTVRAAEGKGGKKGGMSVEATMEKLTTELSLTDEQKPKVKEVIEDGAKKRRELMADSSTAPEQKRPKMREITDDQEKKMKEILKPAQFDKYKKWVEETRAGKGGGGKKKKSE